MERVFGFIGGDKRSEVLKSIMVNRGYKVLDSGESIEKIDEILESCQYLVFGIPMCRSKKILLSDGEYGMKLEELAGQLQEGHHIFGGLIPYELLSLTQYKGVCFTDFMKEESYAIYNAISTAEGVIYETMKERQTNVYQSNCLVLGFGRCGKVIGDKLKGLSANVTICSADISELAYAEALGFQTLDKSKLLECVGEFENLYNTIPALVLKREILEQMSKEQLIIDIASGRGGVDYDYALEHEINAIHLLGIPGQYAPWSVAQKMAELMERKIENNV